MQTTAELREGFLRFFEEKDHLRLPSAPLIPPPEDQSTLFIIAGMQPLQRYFLGLAEPPAKRLTTVQKVMRAGGKHNDLDDVGRTIRHESFYEMLGNFSVGDYFKEGAVELGWEFVTERMGFEPDLLWATVFAGDPELGLGEDEAAVAAWRRIGMPRERIVALPRSDNFWQAADTGPCGPNSEIFYDRGEAYGCGRPDCAPGCECDRFLEFWNLVFMEFELKEDGSLVTLPLQNVDTGLGLERGAMLLQGVDSVFETDVFTPIREWVEAQTGIPLGASEAATKAHRVLCDHGRAMTFLVADGVTPSNEGRGYVLRRVIRRAVLHARGIGLEDVWPVTRLVVEEMGDAYPELREHAADVERAVRAEEERFAETLARGMRLFEDVAAGGEISGEDAFKLHDTFGFPLELTRELAIERGLAVDEETFTRLMTEQRLRSRAAGAPEAEVRIVGGRPTEFVGYERTEVLTAIIALEPLGDGRFQAKLERSPFYPEGGGQVSDAGFIENEETGARADLVRAIRLPDDDQVLVFEGEGFAEGARVRAVVPWSVRYPTMANHTATHLLHRALQEVLGEHARQAGSAVRPDKLRFDFTHTQALTPDERDEIEQRVNQRIWENLPVRAFVTPLEEARKLGAMMLFGEKYGDEVRVVEISGYSRELCGGTHVRWTAEIGPFVLLSESSVGAGVRRIEAVTAGEAWAYLRARAEDAAELRAEIERVRREKRETPATARAEAPPPRVRRVGDANVVVSELAGWNADQLLELSDRLKAQHRPAVVVLGSSDNGRVHLIATVDGTLVERGVNASDVVREAAAVVGGGGGGRPTMARAGGREPEKLPQALAVAEQAAVERLGG
jgi:alanyl-tRNA synthetase